MLKERIAAQGVSPDGLAQLPETRPAPRGDFRFYDNRQKYLMFVNTCSEKWMIAQRIAAEIDNLEPRPPALRVFDAGIGDGTVLSRAMRAMHARFAHVPFYIAGKEISLEDVRLALDKMPDRLFEHPATVLAITNISYADAPRLTLGPSSAHPGMVWKSIALTGSTTAEFERQILELQPFLAAHWRTRTSPRTGSLVPETPTVLVLYRADHAFALDAAIPQPSTCLADYDLVIASQPYRLRAPIAFKARRVLAPLARALGPGGRLLGIHSAGQDPAQDIVTAIWPDEQPFVHSRRELMAATRQALGIDAADFSFDPATGHPAQFRYAMHTLPDEIETDAQTVGTSTLLAAWNAATYVAQIDEERLAQAMTGSAYLDATRAVLRTSASLWFNNESYLIVRKHPSDNGASSHDRTPLEIAA